MTDTADTAGNKAANDSKGSGAPVFLIIAGTSYGRSLSEKLWRAGAAVYTSVATEYGRELMEKAVRRNEVTAGNIQNLRILEGRADMSRMSEILARVRPDAVINAAHPYAAEATRNIRGACEAAGVRYLRLLRDSRRAAEDAFHAADMSEAAEFLNTVPGNIFSACGGKEIRRLTAIEGYRERVYIRALPTAEFLNECKALGFASENIICMQGPFSTELNAAMLRHTRAEWLITKDSGDAGGFAEKLEAAASLGVGVVVIGRPIQEEGLFYRELIETLNRDFDLDLDDETADSKK